LLCGIKGCAFGLLIIWYVPRTDSRFAVFTRAVPKASAVLGLVLNLLILSSGFFFFRYFGLLVDAASIFIILSAVMSCFFSTALLHDDAGPQAAHAQVREDDNTRTGNAQGLG
jgi:adenylate cyclase